MPWLAYAHPVAMAVLLALGLWVLRLGLRLRRARLGGRPGDSSPHRALARWVVPALVLGYAAGIASQTWLRRGGPFESVHFPMVSLALLALLAAGILGLAMERGWLGSSARAAHGGVGAFGILIALAAAVAGMALLP